MNIGIDIDDTISKTTEAIDEMAKYYTENILKREFKLNEDKEILDPMWAKYLYGWTTEENDKFWDLYYEKIMSNLSPKDNVIQIINNLSQKNKIVIITARWDRTNGSIAKITNEWLERQGIHYDKIFMGHEDKRKIAMENNIDIFIDDNYKTCKQISELGIRTLIMNSRLNKNIKDDTLERVFSWEDIEGKIKEEC